MQLIKAIVNDEVFQIVGFIFVMYVVAWLGLIAGAQLIMALGGPVA